MGLRLAHHATFLATCLLGLAFSASRAEAQDRAPHEALRGPFALHWVRLAGAGDCIAGDALARDVEAKLGRTVFPASRDAQVLIEGHVERRAEGYRAELRMTDSAGGPIGSRALSSAQPNCRELSETLSVVLAVMIDPDAETKQRKPEPAKPAAQPAKPLSPGDLNHKANHLLAFVRLMINVVPEPSFGFGAAYERALGRAGGLRIEGVYLADDFTPDEQLPGTTQATAVSLRLVYAGVAYCPLWLSLARLRVAGCAGTELGSLKATGRNFSGQQRDAKKAWISGSAALRFALRLVASLDLHAGAALVLTSKHQYTAENAMGEHPTIQTTGPVGGAFDLGLGARF